MDDVVEHHGVKGQKWGVRNTPTRPNEARAGSPAHAKRLTDKQLRDAIDRMRMEKQYSELHGQTSIKSGGEIASDILKKYGKTAANIAVSAAVGLAFNEAKKRLLG